MVLLCATSILGMLPQQPSAGHASVLFTVTDSAGRYISGLTKEDFRILQDGKLRPITSVDYKEDAPLSIEVLFDPRASKNDQLMPGLDVAKQFLRLTLKNGIDNASVTLVDRPDVTIQEPTTNLVVLEVAIDRIAGRRPSRGGPLSDAIASAAKRLSGAPGRRVIFLVNAGRVGPLKDTIQTLRENHVPLYVVHGKETYLDSDSVMESGEPLRKVSEGTGGIAHLHDPRVGSIEAALKRMATELKYQYAVTFQSETGISPEKAAKVRIEVTRQDANRKDLTVRQSDYYPAK